jgi:hypothetical protein
MSVESRQLRADAKALEQWAVDNRPRRLRSADGLAVYAVYSRAALRGCPHCGSVLPATAAVYLVSELPGGGLACDCEAGQAKAICWHVASVRHLRRWEDILPEGVVP